MTNAIPNRAMVIMAHPDDIEYFVGGTVALWASAETDITLVLTTGGEGGSDDRNLSAAMVSSTRQEEQRAAAQVLGAKRVIFLHEPDGEVVPSLSLRQQLVREIRRHRPDAIITFDPARYTVGDTYINHPDHRATGEAVLAAVAPAARNWRYHPEFLADDLEPHVVSTVWLVLAPEPNESIDVTPVIDTKVAAMHCHVSQIRDATATEQALRATTAQIGAGGHVQHREYFRCIHNA